MLKDDENLTTEYRLYICDDKKTIEKQVLYNPVGANTDMYATIEEAIEYNKTSLSVMADGLHSQILLDISDSRKRKIKNG